MKLLTTFAAATLGALLVIWLLDDRLGDLDTLRVVIVAVLVAALIVGLLGMRRNRAAG